MKRIAMLITIVSALTTHGLASPANADILFESGTLGQTGIPWSDLENGTVPGTNVSQFVFPGVRFEVTQPVKTSGIGGHFASQANGAFFGALVALDDVNDFPDSNDLSSPDVLGTTTLTFPNPSAEMFGDLKLSLEPGWYALVFGSGLFGSTAHGGAPQNNPDIGNPSYIAFQTGAGWRNLADSDVFDFVDYRFVILGVPEPSTVILVALAVLSAVRIRITFRPQ